MKNIVRSFAESGSAVLLGISSASKCATIGVVRATRAASIALLCGVVMAVTPTFAQTIINPSYSTRVTVLRFEPPNPTVGQLVVPIVEGVWHNGCLPKIGQASGGSLPRTFILTLPPATSICTQALQPYKIELPGIVFSRSGEYEFQLLGEAGEFFALKLLTVFALGSTVPQEALPGLWFEPETSGSGLFMTRNLVGTVEQVFGAWFYYTPAGTPAWVSFQEGVWQSPGVLVGNIYETNADPKICVPFDPACTLKWLPAPATKITKTGSFRITVTNAFSAELVLSSAISSSRTIHLIKQIR